MRAASIFAAIPPLPSPPPITASKFSNELTSLIRFTFGFFFGSPSKSPSTSVRIANKSASTKCDTSDANMSFSPKSTARTSSKATASFSLIIGIIPQSSKFLSVVRAFKYPRRLAKSRRVNRTCAVALS